MDLHVETHATAQEFLDVYDRARPGCLVLDVRMPGLSGLDLQEKLSAQQIRIPIIFITGHGEVSAAVRAMKSGAIDFIEKPFSDQVLLNRIQQAIAQDVQARRDQVQRAKTSARLAVLTPREREVLTLVVAGRSNKAIAAQLGVSSKTVEAHRANVMKKMKVHSLSELVRLYLAGERDKEKP